MRDQETTPETRLRAEIERLQKDLWETHRVVNLRGDELERLRERVADFENGRVYAELQDRLAELEARVENLLTVLRYIATMAGDPRGVARRAVEEESS